MKSICYLSILLLLSTIAAASDFASINIKNWQKEEISRDHLRFQNTQKKYVIHLQVDSFDKDKSWEEKSLDADIKKMVEIRAKMSSFLGIDQFQITDYQLKKLNKMSTLALEGSYIRLGKQKIHFKEINFYYQAHFLQLKIIAEEVLPTEAEVKKIIEEISPEQVAID